MHGGREIWTKVLLIASQDEVFDREKDIRYKDNMRNNLPGHSIVKGNKVMN